MRKIAEELADIAGHGLLREPRHLETGQGCHVELAGRPVLNFSSNDYLGLSGHPRIRRAASAAALEFGAGSGASRLICGGLPPHRQLEEASSRFLGTAAALSFANGYSAALGTLGAFLQKGDVVILDKLCHACLIDGARLSGASIRVFPHNRIDRLRELVSWAVSKVDPHKGRVLVVTESIFSMDGDRTKLAEIVEVTKAAGVLLLLDEAHALGILGEDGKGLAAEQGVTDNVDLRMATMGKAAGAAGGIVAGSQDAIALLWNRARSFIYSTAPPPAQAAAAIEGLALIASSEGTALRSRLTERVEQFHQAFSRAYPVAGAVNKAGPAELSPIIPVLVGGERQAVEASQKLLEAGILCPAVRYPTVPRGTARLRITLSAAHKAADIETLVTHLRRTLPENVPHHPKVAAQ